MSARHGVTQIGMTDEAMFNWATSTMSGEGIAKASWGRIDPPLHVLAGDRLWCTEAWTVLRQHDRALRERGDGCAEGETTP